MRSADRSGLDTISNLPCNILEGILGCLPLKDAVKTSILSRDWRCPLLERLTLNWCTAFDTLEIDAANLKWFNFKGKSKSICFKNALMLEKLILHLNSPVSMIASPVCSNLTKFFSNMPCLMELDISSFFLEYLTMGGLPENHLTALNNVKSFSIRGMFFKNVNEVSGAIYLITSCPKLQKLTIECGMINEVVEPVVRYLQDQSSLCGAVKLLQRVHMIMFNGLEIEMEFLRLILASAPVLEEISFWSYEHLLCQSSEQIKDQMKQFQRASPNVEFIIDVVVLDDALL